MRMPAATGSTSGDMTWPRCGATRRPSTAESTENAGVITPSPKNSATPITHDQVQQAPRGGAGGALGQGHQGHRPALAAVVGAHEHGDVFDRHDQGQGPQDQADHAQHRHLRRALRPGMGQGLAQGVERAGADVAEHHPQRAEGQGGEAAPAAALRLRFSQGGRGARIGQAKPLRRALRRRRVALQEIRAWVQSPPWAGPRGRRRAIARDVGVDRNPLSAPRGNPPASGGSTGEAGEGGPFRRGRGRGGAPLRPSGTLPPGAGGRETGRRIVCSSSLPFKGRVDRAPAPGRVGIPAPAQLPKSWPRG